MVTYGQEVELELVEITEPLLLTRLAFIASFAYP
jgi:hypothetical protein